MIINLFASTCVLCDQTVSGPVSLCDDCRNDLPWIDHACHRCGAPLPQAVQNQSGCGQCIDKTLHADYTISALHYVSPVDYLVTQLKFHQQLGMAAILSDLLNRFLQQNRSEQTCALPDLIIPVPLHNKRLIKRGFNQSLEIAKPVARKHTVALGHKTVLRTKNTLPQTDLDAKQRRKNIRNSFAIPDGARIANVSHVVILDDVVTTGATCNELARLLKKSGIPTVGVWSVARA